MYLNNHLKSTLHTCAVLGKKYYQKNGCITQSKSPKWTKYETPLDLGLQEIWCLTMDKSSFVQPPGRIYAVNREPTYCRGLTVSTEKED